MTRSWLFYRCWQLTLAAALLIATIRVATSQPEGHLIFNSTGPSGLFIVDTKGQQVCAFEYGSNLRLSPDGRSLAFTRRLNAIDFTVGIFVMPLFEVDGKANRISDAASATTIPIWSPDGSRIAFIREEPGTDGRYTTRISEVMLMNADGSDLRRIGGGIIDIYNYDLIWSANGQAVHFWGWQNGANIGLHRVDLATHETEFIPNQFQDGGGRWTRSAVSPDGTKRVITEKHDDGRFAKLLRDETTGETHFLTDYEPTWNPIWSPDSRRMVLEHYHYDPIHIELSIVDTASGMVYPVEAAGLSSLNPTWSPDGEFLTYSAYTYSPENKFGPFSQQVIVDARGRIVRQFDSGRVGNIIWANLDGSPLVESCAKAA
jgi:Tol biopolymer transport system component